jgi:hypothetical protein
VFSTAVTRRADLLRVGFDRLFDPKLPWHGEKSKALWPLFLLSLSLFLFHVGEIGVDLD